MLSGGLFALNGTLLYVAAVDPFACEEMCRDSDLRLQLENFQARPDVLAQFLFGREHVRLERGRELR